MGLVSTTELRRNEGIGSEALRNVVPVEGALPV
ncbi:MAG: hypothetical protein ACI8QS_003779 [Planctomycetota bacterium]|jgi:hypothetical protein